MTGIAEVENAILARLKAAGDADVLGYRFRTLESYPDEFDAYLKEKIRGDKPFPAAWTIFGGWRNMEDQGSTVTADAVFMLVVAAQNLRNETAQRHGGAAGEVGSYQLVGDGVALIHGQHLGLDIGVLKAGACRAIRPTATITDRKLSVFALEFSTRMPFELGGFPDREIGDFSTFHANWDVAPFGGLDADPDAEGVQLPADDQADATDHLELDQ